MPTVWKELRDPLALSPRLSRIGVSRMRGARNDAFFSAGRGGSGDRSGGSERKGPKAALTAALKRARGTGRLNLTQLSLAAVPSELFALADTIEEGEKWWECYEISSIDMSMNEITALPPDIGTLGETILQLKIAHNKLAVLPPELCNLVNLKVLDLSNNLLRELPADLGRMSSLVELTVADCQLERLPDSLCGLPGLEIIHADRNRLTRLPAGLGLCARLRDLTVSENELVLLPESLSQCSKLHLLEARKNRIKVAPVLSGMTSLTLLDLRENELPNVPVLPATTTLEQLFLGALPRPHALHMCCGLHVINFLGRGSLARHPVAVLFPTGMACWS